MIYNRQEYNRKSAVKYRQKKEGEFEKMKDDILDLHRDNIILREHLNGLTAKL